MSEFFFLNIEISYEFHPSTSAAGSNILNALLNPIIFFVEKDHETVGCTPLTAVSECGILVFNRFERHRSLNPALWAFQWNDI